MARNYYGKRRNPWAMAFLVLLLLVVGFLGGYYFFSRKGRLPTQGSVNTPAERMPELRKALSADQELLERALDIHREGIAAAELMRRFVAAGGVESDSLLAAYHQLFAEPALPGAEPARLQGLLEHPSSWSPDVRQLYLTSYTTLEEIRETHTETQFFNTYYPLTLDWIANNQWFDEQGRLVGFRPAPRFNASLEKYRMLNLLDRMIIGRRHALKAVSDVLEEVRMVRENLPMDGGKHEESED